MTRTYGTIGESGQYAVTVTFAGGSHYHQGWTDWESAKADWHEAVEEADGSGYVITYRTDETGPGIREAVPFNVWGYPRYRCGTILPAEEWPDDFIEALKWKIKT
ncbi:hypothetical protein ACFY0N_30860 [Streptomyces vinaceus]|uniref:hypothetical protein n=1 Tax=Streptomyces vinaceus TaxID=1960 RepID=UPI003681C6D8